MELKKTLGTYDVFSLAAGAMISSGIFILPSAAFSETGSWAILAYFLAGLLMVPALFSMLELATALPRAGGTYFYIERILGSASGLAAGFANWFSIALKSALALVGIGFFAEMIFPELTAFQLKMISAGACVVFTLINLFSVESAGHSQGILVVILLLILAQFVVLGYRAADGALLVASAGKPDWNGIIPVTGMVFISYGGLTHVGSVAEEVKDPGKSLVKGSIMAFLIVQTLYVLIVAVLSALLPAAEFSASHSPLTDGAAGLFSAPAARMTEVVLLSAAAIVAFVTTANAGIMSASRVPLAMSRDRMVPRFFGRLDRKGIPRNSIIMTALFMLGLIFAFDLKDLARTASLFMLLLFMMVNLSVIVIRSTDMTNYRPVFKSPFYPVLQVAGIGIYGALIFNMGLKPIIIAAVFITFSVLWYLIFVRKHMTRKSALVYMVEKLVDPDFVTSKEALEEELLGILMVRDEIEDDRFSGIVKDAIVLDFNEKMSRNELFGHIADHVAERWNLDGRKIDEQLHKRESEAETLIYPGIALPHAIPHAIIDGENLFDIVLVRNRSGIVWNDEGVEVHTAFCLIGSKDEREFHLKALMSIAQILQSPGFVEDWENARTPEELRTVMLLAKRRTLKG